MTNLPDKNMNNNRNFKKAIEDTLNSYRKDLRRNADWSDTYTEGGQHLSLAQATDRIEALFDKESEKSRATGYQDNLARIADEVGKLIEDIPFEFRGPSEQEEIAPKLARNQVLKDVIELIKKFEEGNYDY